MMLMHTNGPPTRSKLHWLFNRMKQDLSTPRLENDQVQQVDRDLISELNLRSDEFQHQIINMDETHHDISISGHYWKPRWNKIYHLSQPAWGSHHVVGVYATTLFCRWTLPPIIAVSSRRPFKWYGKWLGESLPNYLGAKSNKLNNIITPTSERARPYNILIEIFDLNGMWIAAAILQSWIHGIVLTTPGYSTRQIHGLTCWECYMMFEPSVNTKTWR